MSESIEMRLQSAIARAQLNIETSQKNEIQRRQLNRDIKEAKESLEVLMTLSGIFKTLTKDIGEYQADKQNSTISAIYSAIYSARSIVLESGNIVPHIQAGEFWLENGKGKRISRLEGEGVKALVSFFVRKTVLKNTDFLDTMILDESIATVSNSNSAEFSKYLPSLSRDMQIIMIEQNPTAFENATGIIEYRVEKEGDTSRVVREVNES